MKAKSHMLPIIELIMPDQQDIIDVVEFISLIHYNISVVSILINE
jgi:hypothetical protein